MGLIIARRIDEEFVLFAAPDANPDQLAEQLKEGITIRMHNIERGKACLDISAPDEITILRSTAGSSTPCRSIVRSVAETSEPYRGSGGAPSLL